ncbi:MAG: c-type cytochrome [Campylobacterales bacterium]
MKFQTWSFILGVGLLATQSLAYDVGEYNKRTDRGFKMSVPMTLPDESKIPNNQYGEMVRYGKELFVHTYKYIGPDVADPALRYSGNNLSCQTCHLDAGTRPHSAPMVGIHSNFPQYRPREDVIGTIEERINGCMQRSMNGYPLPNDSKEMKAFVTYFHWLSQGVPSGATVQGKGLKQVDRKMVRAQAADPVNGAKVYEMHCASCHMPDGSGVKNPPSADGTPAGYTFPPLWGEDSYNTGAGMHRTLKAADFIYSNMPLGATGDNPILTPKEAYDVAAYLNNNDKYRPAKINRERDFPDLKVKVPDQELGPYLDEANAPQYKHGPYGKIIILPKK